MRAVAEGAVNFAVPAEGEEATLQATLVSRDCNARAGLEEVEGRRPLVAPSAPVILAPTGAVLVKVGMAPGAIQLAPVVAAATMVVRVDITQVEAVVPLTLP